MTSSVPAGPPANVIRWFQCECGNKHAAAGVSEISVCTCGRKLYRQMWVKGR